MPRFFLPVLLGLLSGIGDVAAAEGSNDGFVLYSDVCLHAESGDLLGTRIGLIKLPEATYLFYQDAEGELGSPEIRKLSRDELKGAKLNFPVSGGAATMTFQGTITKTAITGSYSNHGIDPHGKTVLHLKKVVMPEKYFQECR